MKKLVTLLACISAGSALFAQGIGIGIKAGVNFANVSAPSNIDASSITSFHGGGYININLSDKFGFTPEVLWTAFGSKLGNAELNTDYISIPVMLRFKPISLISLEAGPQFNLLVNAEFNGQDIKDQLKNNEFGVGFGAGLHLPLGLNAGARYIIGFTNIGEASAANLRDSNNRTFQIYAGWTLFGAK